MVRPSLRGAIVLSAVLATACELVGGQTGQPTSGRGCHSVPLSSSAAWGDTTVLAATEVFAGTYEPPLLWQQEPRSASAHTPVDFDDRLQLTIAYAGASAIRDCAERLTIPVTVTLSTSASGIVESGDATLEIFRSPEGVLSANLSYTSDRVVLDARLTKVGGAGGAGGSAVAAGVTLAGGFDSLDAQLPGASATFAVEP